MAIFLSGFLWLCCPKVGETRDKAFRRPRLHHRLLIAVKNEVLGPLAGPAESNSKSQDWYPKGLAWSTISDRYSGGNTYPSGGHTTVGFC